MASVTGARQLSLPADDVMVATCDQRAWNALVECYSQQVWSLTRDRGLNPIEAAELSQLVWLSLGDHLADIPGEDQIGPWLCAAAGPRGAQRSRPTGMAATGAAVTRSGPDLSLAPTGV
jgi:hypothetical protein